MIEVLGVIGGPEQVRAVEAARGEGGARVAAAAERGLTAPAPEVHEELAGLGVMARVDGQEILVGSGRLLSEWGVTVPDGVPTRARVLVAVGGRLQGALDIADPVRADAPKAVAALKGLGLQVVVLSGDRREIVEDVARQVGADRVLAEVLPHALSQVHGGDH